MIDPKYIRSDILQDIVVGTHNDFDHAGDPGEELHFYCMLSELPSAIGGFILCAQGYDEALNGHFYIEVLANALNDMIFAGSDLSQEMKFVFPSFIVLDRSDE